MTKAKLTLTSDKEDDNSIYNHRDDAEEPARTQNHISIEFLFNGCP